MCGANSEKLWNFMLQSCLLIILFPIDLGDVEPAFMGVCVASNSEGKTVRI